jgi:hypothetical protein
MFQPEDRSAGQGFQENRKYRLDIDYLVTMLKPGFMLCCNSTWYYQPGCGPHNTYENPQAGPRRSRLLDPI